MAAANARRVTAAGGAGERLASLRGAARSAGFLVLEMIERQDRSMRLRSDDVRKLAKSAKEDGQPVDLSGRNLSHLGLDGIDLSGANLSHARLVQTYLTGSNLQDVDFSESDLSSAYLSRADLRRAKFRQAYLFQTGLEQANLEGADFQGANLRGARLRDANLKDTDLSGAFYNDKTEWPLSFDPEAAGAEYRP
jgi:uncharacterized protein YjbI with pentapeptide repeats